jgi:type I restriction enzyme S subunit
VKDGWVARRLSDICIIKPPKSEATRLLKDSDLVSFVPMENLGIDQKFFEPKLTRKLNQVSGSYTYFADGDVLLAKITPCFENGKLGIARNLTNRVGFGSSEYIVFRPNGVLNNEYLYYFLLQDGFRAEGTKTMSGAVGHMRLRRSRDQNELRPIERTFSRVTRENCRHSLNSCLGNMSRKASASLIRRSSAPCCN